MTIALLLLSLVWWTEKIICPISSTLWPVDLKMNFSQFSKKKKLIWFDFFYLSAPTSSTWQQHDMDEWTFPQSWKYTCWQQMRPASTKCPTHLKAIIIVVVGTLQIPNQYKQNGKSSTLGSFFDWFIDQLVS